MPKRRHALVLSAVLVVGSLGACSSDDDDTTADETTADETTSTTEVEAAEPLQILVSNDDGYEAEGIDALVEGLATLDDVEIIVVAPLGQQSGQGGNETEGELAVTDVATASGVEAKGVEGFPADAIRVAIDDLGIEPDLVVTGINEGQNLGPIVDISGTVGAARAAARRGFPALATSQGFADEFDYDVAVPLILDWITERREDLVSGEAEAVVTSLNIPSCDEGELRGVLEVEHDVDGDGGQAVLPQDCTSTVAEAELTTDMAAFNNGFASITVVTTEPVS